MPTLDRESFFCVQWGQDEAYSIGMQFHENVGEAPDFDALSSRISSCSSRKGPSGLCLCLLGQPFVCIGWFGSLHWIMQCCFAYSNSIHSGGHIHASNITYS